MFEAAIADSRAEEPLFFSSGTERLFGLLTAPTTQANGVGVVLMTARGTYHRNRLSVRLARRLARHGYHVLRFDLTGVGESGGAADFALERPLVDDVAAAAALLEERGLERFVLVGSCFGARSALAAAMDIDSLEALVLAVMPFSDSRTLPTTARRSALRRLARLLRRAIADPRGLKVLGAVVGRAARRRWIRLTRADDQDVGRSRRIEKEVEGWLERLVQRGVPTMLLFGAEDYAYQGFLDSLDHWSDELRGDVEELVELKVASRHNIHGRTRIEAQDWLVDVIEEWLEKRA